jgi:hypothetical protein
MKNTGVGITSAALAAVLCLAMAAPALAVPYTDNGDGTITDNTTGLMWEKKDDSGGIHDRDNLYGWANIHGPFITNGSMWTQFLPTLNTPPCFAGYCDWRIPNVKELQSLLDFQIPFPGLLVQGIFNNPGGCPQCTDVTLPTCSCTGRGSYWASTTYMGRRTGSWAWYVDFRTGRLGFHDKFHLFYVRAVRGGV